MIIKNAKFIVSAADSKGFYQTDKPIVSVSGRSNVGKSSFINMLANQRKLAKTSDTPGRTRLVNYFDFGEFVLADLPGYGFAKVSKEEKLKWARTLDDFFEKTHIAHVFALVDIRHEPTQDDVDMIKFLYAKIIPFTVVTTKADKLSKLQLKKQQAVISSKLGLGASDIISTDYSGFGKDVILSKLDDIISGYENLEELSEEDDFVEEIELQSQIFDKDKRED